MYAAHTELGEEALNDNFSEAKMLKRRLINCNLDSLQLFVFLPKELEAVLFLSTVSASVYLRTTIKKQQIMPQKTNHIRTAFILFPGHQKQPYSFLVRCPEIFNRG